MKRRDFVCTLGGTAAFLAALDLQGETVQGLSTRPHWNNLHYAIYFCYWEIEKLLLDAAVRRQTLDYFAPVRAEHFYLEGDSEHEINVAQMKGVADAMRDAGYRVSGAIVPAVSPGPTCFNNPGHMAVLEQRANRMAQVFDEIILDDWLFTICTCEKCVAGRGQSSWADYRTRLLLEKSRKHLIEPAKAANPKLRMIIKYPNWYEGHGTNGYDVENETHQFDAMAVGIETRTRAMQDQHIPIYSGYVFQKWWPGVEPKKWIGSWLDNYGMKDQPNDYVAQVWQAVFAQAPEIILWSAGNLHSTGPFSNIYPHFCKMLPEFDRVAGMLRGTSQGVPMYLPYGSTGEYNVFGYLGMAGIPVAPVGEFPVESKAAIFTLHSLRDADVAGKMLARLRNGKDVIMTWSLFRELGDSEFKNTLNLVDQGGSVSSAVFRISETEGGPLKSERPFVFPRIATTTWPYAREVAVIRDDYDYAVLLKVKYLSGNLYILNLPENSYDLMRLPAPVLNKVRSAFSADLGVQLLGPGSVALYPFGNGQYALYNMSDALANVALAFEGPRSESGWRELAHGKAMKITREEYPEDRHHKRPARTSVSLDLQPFEVAIVQAP